ncbi:hypothetical protein BaRGS_00017997 [Batillaria attramentaria]|uniref:diacylglycerol cholinephosphotransferase n=1 Tax=Batillaria attramentaria TaxID=370345 RepID=A0ABD0KUM5_9CAEN
MARILSDSQLKRLSEHKYSAGGTSLLEPFLQPYWRWLVEQTPLWVAPNLLTIAGLIINIVSTLFLIYYSPDAKSEIPWWPLVMAGVGLFMYQSLDAIDGKQARRTNSSSPLGELFDHGCDSVSLTFVTLGVTTALSLGQDTNLLLFENLAAAFIFYCAHWQTYVSGTLKFGKLDVTEGQTAVIGVYFITALLGVGFWQKQVPLLGVQVKVLPVAFSIFGYILQIKSHFSTIFLEGGIGKNKSTVAGTSTVFPLFPMGAVIGMAVMVAFKSPSHVYENHPCLYLTAFGIVMAKVTNRLVVAHMTKSEMDLWDTGLIGPGLLVVNQYFNCVFSEYLVLWICMVVVTVDIWRYSLTVCQEICQYLGIYCFVITSKPPKQRPASSDGSLKATSSRGSK